MAVGKEIAVPRSGGMPAQHFLAHFQRLALKGLRFARTLRARAQATKIMVNSCESAELGANPPGSASDRFEQALCFAEGGFGLVVAAGVLVMHAHVEKSLCQQVSR